MPVEVRELVIQATIAQEDASGGMSSAGASPNGSESATEAIVKLCVEKVMEILREKNER